MKITFHGAAQTVTGSQHLIEFEGKRILLDCGLYQGRRKDTYARNKHLPFDAGSIDALILSHAHIDHSGNIPNLVKSGFDRDIFCTYATRDLCVSMLQDSGHIQEKDAEFFNRKIRKRDEAPIEPLYTKQDALNSLTRFQSLHYARPHEILPNVELTFIDAGHMLGSAIVCLKLGGTRVVFSGDIGHHGLPIIRDPQTIQAADILIMESTYGNRLHPAEGATEDALVSIIQRTTERGGVIIIPSFAVGRTQQLVYMFQKLVAQNRIPNIPIFVDSPLATDVTAVYRNHPEIYDDEIRDYIESFNDDDPFGFHNLVYTRDVEASKALNTRQGAFIVVSASGMAEAGRILHHLRNRIGDSRNTVLFVGWQAPETLGRRLLDGQKRVRIFGEEHEVRAEITSISGLSGHADANELVDWAKAIQDRPHHTFLVHGELEPAEALAQRLQTELDFKHVTVPALHQEVTF